MPIDDLFREKGDEEYDEGQRFLKKINDMQNMHDNYKNLKNLAEKLKENKETPDTQNESEQTADEESKEEPQSEANEKKDDIAKRDREKDSKIKDDDIPKENLTNDILEGKRDDSSILDKKDLSNPDDRNFLDDVVNDISNKNDDVSNKSNDITAKKDEPIDKLDGKSSGNAASQKPVTQNPTGTANIDTGSTPSNGPGGTTAGAGGATVGAGAGAGGAAAGAGTAAAAPVILIVVGVVYVVVIFIIFLTSIYSYTTPKNISEIVGRAATSFFYNQVDDMAEWLESFWYFINPFEDSPTSDTSLTEANVPIPQAYTDYDPTNSQDMALIEEYKLIQVALSRAYDNSLEVLKTKCEECGYDYALSLSTIQSKYPNGWQDVYKDINYGQLIVAMYLYIYDDEDIWGNSAADIEEMKQNYIESMKNGTTDETYTFSGLMLGKIEDLLLAYNSTLNLYQMGYTIKDSDGVQYLDIEIKPFCWNQIYDLIGRFPEDYYDEQLNLTYSEIMDVMLDNLRATCENPLGEKRAIYNTLKLDNEWTEWETSFEANSIHSLYSLYATPQLNEYNEQILYIMLRSEGYSVTEASAICGNIRYRNAYRTGESDGAIGICRWNINGVGAQLKQYAENNDLDPYSIYTQSAFLIELLKSSGINEELTDTLGVQEATDLVYIKFETMESFASKEEWKNANPGTEWEQYAYSSVDERYHYVLATCRTDASRIYNELSHTAIMFWPAPGNSEILENGDYGTHIVGSGGDVTEVNHWGIDIKCNLNDPVIASASGKVEKVGYHDTNGNYVVINHNTKYQTRYYHLDSYTVAAGDTVLAGETIGYAGKSGNATIEHLHFAVKKIGNDGEYHFVSPWTVTNEEISYEEVSLEIVQVAESAIGKIPYVYGGKAEYPGVDARWAKNEAGLDCSGFVQWVYWTATGNKNANLGSTSSISSTQTQITYSDLQIGDIGLKFIGGSNGTRYNHAGIYAGKDDDGKDLWIHCTSGNINNVTKNNYSGFTVYFRVNQDDLYNETNNGSGANVSNKPNLNGPSVRD